MIKSKTWNTTPGLNYIQDSELAFATVYSVKREGTGHDKFVGGADTNRKHIHEVPIGRISFPIVFNPGERVFAIYRPATGAEPPPVCVAVDEITAGLPNAVIGVPYLVTISLTGTPPFVITDITKPSWMTITNSGSTITLTGTPTSITPENVQFTVTNCGGSIDFDQTFFSQDPTPNLLIFNNSTSGVFITSVGGITYTLQSGSIPIANGQNISAIHANYTGIIGIGISGVVFPYSLKLYRNVILLENLPVLANGGYIFGSQTYLSTDEIQIILGP